MAYLYIIRSKNCVLNVAAVRYSLHNAMKRNYAKNYNSPFACHLFSSASEFMEAKKLTMKYMLFGPYSEELCNKNCVVKTSETLII